MAFGIIDRVATAVNVCLAVKDEAQIFNPNFYLFLIHLVKTLSPFYFCWVRVIIDIRD